MAHFSALCNTHGIWGVYYKLRFGEKLSMSFSLILVGGFLGAFAAWGERSLILFIITIQRNALTSYGDKAFSSP